MACESIAVRLADLQDQQKQLQEVMANLKGVGLAAAQEQLADVTTDIATEQKNLADCKAIAAQEGHPTQRPFIAQVKDIYCGAASRELGNDEPYLLIASVLMNSPVVAGLPVAKPAVHCFKVGPWGGVRSGLHPPREQARRLQQTQVLGPERATSLGQLAPGRNVPGEFRRT